VQHSRTRHPDLVGMTVREKRRYTDLLAWEERAEMDAQES